MEQSLSLKALIQKLASKLFSGEKRSESSMVTVKFLCSYAGKTVPRYPDGKLRYVGGETRVLSVDRSISFSELLLKLGELCGAPVCGIRCQLPTDDLDALVSVTSDEDLANVIEEYDRDFPPPSYLKIRAFLSQPRSARKLSPSTSSSSSSTNTSITGSAPKFPKSAANRCLAPQISAPPASFRLVLEKSAAGKFRSHYQYRNLHHQNGCYGHGSSNSCHTFLVHSGNYWK